MNICSYNYMYNKFESKYYLRTVWAENLTKTFINNTLTILKYKTLYFNRN